MWAIVSWETGRIAETGFWLFSLQSEAIRTEIGSMVRISRRRGGNGLLVRSDLDDLGAARREVGVWVRERAADARGAVRTLKIAEEGRVVREYLVLEDLETELPSPTPSTPRVSSGARPNRIA